MRNAEQSMMLALKVVVAIAAIVVIGFGTLAVRVAYWVFS